MNSGTMTVIVFVVLICGTLLGALVRNVVHGNEIDQDSRQVITLGTGLLGTLAALVLGLLIASAKSSYDAQLAQVRKLTTDIVLLDLVLTQYGPDTHAARELLRRAIDRTIDGIWRGNSTEAAAKGAFKVTAAGEEAFEHIQELTPQNDAQRTFKARAVDVSTELVRTRALLFEQATTNAIPTAFLVVLLFWLTVIFMSFTLFARLNSTVRVVLLILALSVSGAVFLILDMSHPFTGPVQISSAPLRNALSPLVP